MTQGEAPAEPQICRGVRRTGYRGWLASHNSPLTAIAACAAPVGYVAFVHHYAVDALFGDEWNMVPFVSQSLRHGASIGTIWSQYGEPRIPLVRLDLLAFADVAHLDTRWAVLWNAILWVAAYAIVLRLFREFLGERLTPLPVLGVGLAWFSLADVQNALWAFQFGWFLVVLTFVAMLYALLIPTTHRLTWFAVALFASAVGSLSWIQGFVVWPIGLACLIWWRPERRRAVREIVVWLGIAATTAGIYLVGYRFGQSSCNAYFGCTPEDPLTHPMRAGEFLVVLIGNVIPGGYTQGTPQSYVRFGVVGGVLLVAAIGVLAHAWRDRKSSGPAPVPALLIAFALLFDFTIMWGRLGGGLAYAVGGNRYVMPNLVLLTGFVMFAWAHRPWRLADGRRPPRNVLRTWAVFMAIVIALVAQVTVASRFGFAGAGATREFNISSARVAVNLDRIPVAERPCMTITFLVAPNIVPIAAEAQLGEFGPSAYRGFRLAGPPTLPASCKKAPARVSG